MIKRRSNPFLRELSRKTEFDILNFKLESIYSFEFDAAAGGDLKKNFWDIISKFKILTPLGSKRILWPCDYVASRMLVLKADIEWVNPSKTAALYVAGNFYGWHLFYEPLDRFLSLYELGCYDSFEEALEEFNHATKIIFEFENGVNHDKTS